LEQLGKPVNIYNNDLTASKFTDTVDTVTTPASAVANGGVSDIGAITTTSGLNTFKAYFTKVDADADSSAAVYFDTVDSFSPETGSEITTGLEWVSTGTQPDGITVLQLTANTADLGDAVTSAKRSFLLNLAATSSITANGVVFYTGVGSVASPADLTAGLSMNAAYSAIATKSTLAATSAIAEVTLSTLKYGSPQAEFQLALNSTTSENSYAGVAKLGGTAGAFSFGVSDSMTLSVDGSAVTITGASVIAQTTTTIPLGSATSVRAALIAAWNTKYAGNAAGTASANQVRWSLAAKASTASSNATFSAIAKDRGSRDIDAAMSLTHSLGKTTTDSNIGIVIGNDTSLTQSVADNIARGTYLMVTLTAQTAGSILSQIGIPALAQGNDVKFVGITNTASVELTSTYVPNVTASNGATPINIYPAQSRLDVIRPEEANAATTSNAIAFSRIAWFN